MPWKILTSITAITILMSIALFKGIDGLLLTGAIATIAGLGGFTIGNVKKS